MTPVVVGLPNCQRKRKSATLFVRGGCTIIRASSRFYRVAGKRLLSSDGEILATLRDGIWHDAADQLAIDEVHFEHLQRIEFHRPSGALQWLPCQRIILRGHIVEAQSGVIAYRINGHWHTRDAELPVCSELQVR